MRFVVYSQATGLVLRTGNAPDADHMAIQAQGGEVADGDAPSGVTDDGLWQWTASGYIHNPVPTKTTAQLLAYAQSSWETVSNGGIVVNVGTADAPINCSADTTATGRTNLNGLVAMAQLDSSFTEVWYQSSGNVTLTASQLISLGVAVGKFISATYATLSSIEQGVVGGTITTTAQIDSAAWPT